MGHHVLVQGLHLGLAPVHLRHPLQKRQVPAGEPNYPRVMDIDHRVTPGVGDRVAFGDRVSPLKDQLHVGRDALPAVQDVQALEAARVNHIHVQGLGEVVLPIDHDETGSAAIQTPPAQALVDPFPQSCVPFHLAQGVQGLRSIAAL